MGLGGDLNCFKIEIVLYYDEKRLINFGLATENVSWQLINNKLYQEELSF